MPLRITVVFSLFFEFSNVRTLNRGSTEAAYLSRLNSKRNC